MVNFLSFKISTLDDFESALTFDLSASVIQSLIVSAAEVSRVTRCCIDLVEFVKINQKFSWICTKTGHSAPPKAIPKSDAVKKFRSDLIPKLKELKNPDKEENGG